MQRRTEKVCLFVDNCALFSALQNRGVRLDYKRLKDWAVQQRRALIVRYYSGEIRHETGQRSDYYSVLRRAGYEVNISSVLRSQEKHAALDPIIKSMCLLNLVMDMCDLVHTGHYDRFIILSGAPELTLAVSRIQQYGIDVEVIFFEDVCDPTLRAKADTFRHLDVEAVSLQSARGEIISLRSPRGVLAR